MKTSLLTSLFVIWSLMLQSGCGSRTGTDSGIDPNSPLLLTFPAEWQPQNGTTVGKGSQLLIGNFTDDAYPDLLLLGETSGTILYKNAEGKGFAVGVPAAITPNDFSKGVWDAGKGHATLAQAQGNLAVLSIAAGAIAQQTTFSLPFNNRVSSMAQTGDYVFALLTNGPSFMVKKSASNFDSPTTAVADFTAQDGKVMAAILNADSLPDFVAMTFTGDRVKFYGAQNAGVPTLVNGSPLTRSTNNAIRDFQIAQLVDTTALDILVATSAGFELYKNTSTSTGFSFEAASIVLADTAEKFVIGDFINQDGIQDIYLTKDNAKSRLYRQSATNALEFADVSTDAIASANQGTEPAEIYSADFNADGYLDIVEMESNGTIRVFINNRKKL